MAPLAPLLRPAGQKLWRPGQVKPQRVPRINGTHPLALGLVAYWWPVGDSTYIDLVTGDVTKKGTGTKNALPVAGTTAFGPGPSFAPGAAFCESSNLAPNQSWTAPYSFAAGWYQLGATSAPTTGWFGICDAAGNDPFFIFTPGAGTLGFSYGNAASAFTFTPVANTFYVGVGAATGTTAQSSWINGLAQTAGTATSAFSGSAMRYVFGDVNVDSNSSTLFCNAIIFFGAAWLGRALSASDAALLYTDPYCFLVPQEPEMMIIQSAVTDVLAPQIWM